MSEASAIVQTLRKLDRQNLGVIRLDCLEQVFQDASPWWDPEKLEYLARAANVISENGLIRYEELIEWLLNPGAVPASPSRNASKGSTRPASRAGRSKSSLTLRFLHINDVYDLMQFPAMRTAIQYLSDPREADRVVTTMGGDFLAPYLLSGLDKGAGMIDCINNLPISHCCFGNHECDVPHASLLKAIDTFQGTWINSNMKGGGFGENPRLPTYDFIDVCSADGTHSRKVGLLGLLCPDAHLYRDGVFNGAVPSIEPVNDCCERLCRELIGQGCDCVVPMTHQDSSQDKILAARGKEIRVPAILGGHDHLEVCDAPQTDVGCSLVKAGMDATVIGLVDITWGSTRDDWPVVETKLLTTNEFTKCDDMQQIVEKHMAPVWALDHMVACRRPAMEELAPAGAQFPLSSIGTRKGPSSMATFLSSALCDAFECDVAILEGGSVRASSDKYVDYVTMSDLKAEMPFKNETIVVPLPGHVLIEAVRTSRLKAIDKPSAFYLHCDRGCIIDPATHVLHTICGEPADPNRTYTVALGVDLGVGSGVNEPLMSWASANEDVVPDKDLAIQARDALEIYFVKRLWKDLPSFDEIDTAGDDYLWPQEIEAAYLKVFMGGAELDVPQQLACKTMVNHLVKSLDKDGDHKISRQEYAVLLKEDEPVMEMTRMPSKASRRDSLHG